MLLHKSYCTELEYYQFMEFHPTIIDYFIYFQLHSKELNMELKLQQYQYDQKIVSNFMNYFRAEHISDSQHLK